MQYHLFESKKEIVVFVLILSVILGINLLFKFEQFNEFSKQKIHHLNTSVVSSYLKTKENNRTYRVFKLKWNSFNVYTTTKNSFDCPINKNLELNAYSNNITFLNYLKETFYMPSFKLKCYDAPMTLRAKVINKIHSQHETSLTKNFFGAIFMAEPISKELRKHITHWGIAHIVAISGFHIGIIFAFMFFIITPIYRYFQNKYFTYRSLKKDVSIIIFIFLLFYLWLIDFTPSFLRSIIMSLIVFWFLKRNIKIISFQTLFLTIAICIAFIPSLAFSLGFYFSCMGVLFIYLYILHFGGKMKLFYDAIALNIWTFLGMNIPVYYFFHTFSFQQISVIPLSALFVLFYPLMFILHLFGIGGIFDNYIGDFLKFNITSTQILIPFELFLAANLFAVCGIKSKLCASVSVALGVFVIAFI